MATRMTWLSASALSLVLLAGDNGIPGSPPASAQDCVPATCPRNGGGPPEDRAPALPSSGNLSGPVAPPASPPVPFDPAQGNFDPNAGPNGDTDMDGTPNSIDYDDDGDLWGDWLELALGLDPQDRASNGSVATPDADMDSDGWIDILEITAGTDPNDPADTPTNYDGDGEGNPDNDGDGLGDLLELAIGTDPDNPDTDRDGVGDSIDAFMYNPLDPDTDDDGVNDAEDDSAPAWFEESGLGNPDDRPGAESDNANENAEPAGPAGPTGGIAAP